jgi:lysozyme family protein
MTNIAPLITVNGARWIAMHVTPSLEPEINLVAGRLVAAKSRYQNVSNQTKVPWYVIAVIHERESSQNWNDSLAQGDPWNQISVHTPKGRGPFSSWETSAVDALENCSPYAAKWTDWSIGGLLTLLEEYNGLGYFFHGVPSPYIWASTDQYKSGKYVADGQFDPNAVDQQMGCAALLKTMGALDTSIFPVAAVPQATGKTVWQRLRDDI